MVKFDTSDRKPRIINIAVVSVITAALLLYFLFNKTEGDSLRIGVLLSLYLLAVELMLANALIGQLRYNPYSYNTIYYIGFGVFVLFLLLTHLYITANLILRPESFLAEDFIDVLLNSAKNYIFVTMPLLAAFSIALALSNLALIHHEGYRFVNALGIIFGLVLLGSGLVLQRFSFYPFSDVQHVAVAEVLASLCAAILLYVECMLTGAMAASLIAISHRPGYDKDFLIVLGCGLRADGTPTPLLQGRLDRALDFYHEQMDRTGRAPRFVTSGGRGPDEASSESAAMKWYLRRRGVPADQILEEDRSTNTFENMKYSRQIIRRMDPQAKVIFATSNYHVFRSGLFARRVKMRAVGIGAKTKWYFWPNAWVREFAGLLTKHRGKQLLVLGSMIVFYVGLTLVVIVR